MQVTGWMPIRRWPSFWLWRSNTIGTIHRPPLSMTLGGSFTSIETSLGVAACGESMGFLGIKLPQKNDDGVHRSIQPKHIASERIHLPRPFGVASRGVLNLRRYLRRNPPHLKNWSTTPPHWVRHDNRVRDELGGALVTTLLKRDDGL